MSDADGFDEFAASYSATLDATLRGTGGTRDTFAQLRVAQVLRWERGCTAADVLDVGCGDGSTIALLQAALPGARLCGIDPSGESVSIARRDVPGADVRRGDGGDLPWPDEAFDVVYMAGVLHHVPPAQRLPLIGEVGRVLKPGGRLHLFELNPHHPGTRWIVDRCPFDRDALLLSARHTCDLFRKASLQRVDVRYFAFVPRHRPLAPLHALEPLLAHVPLGAQYGVLARRPGSHS